MTDLTRQQANQFERDMLTDEFAGHDRLITRRGGNTPDQFKDDAEYEAYQRKLRQRKSR